MENETDHSLSEHLQRVNALCRLCGEKARRRVKDKDSSIKFCTAYANDVSMFHNLNILDDKDGKHSKILCSKCYTRLNRLKHSAQPSTATLEAALEQIRRASSTWSYFDSTLLAVDQCVTCKYFEQQRKGERPFNTKLGPPRKRNLPTAHESHDLTEDVSPSNNDGDSTLQASSIFCPPSTSTSTPAKVPRTTEMQTPPFERFTAVDVATSPFEKQNTVRP